MGIETAKDLDAYARTLREVVRSAGKILDEMDKSAEKWSKELGRLDQQVAALPAKTDKTKKELDQFRKDMGPAQPGRLGGHRPLYIDLAEHVQMVLTHLAGMLPTTPALLQLRNDLGGLDEVARKLDDKRYEALKKTLEKKYGKIDVTRLKKNDEVLIGMRRGKITEIKEFECAEYYFDREAGERKPYLWKEYQFTIELEDGERLTRRVRDDAPPSLYLGAGWFVKK
ncbi:MAG: hypothetical protein KatS3mg102_0936 [Planctomycetota bacterium]|nr:MAG: hypothetical protein KatS3mg102_0936 [Planctomycetota bacterium]